jgi:fermentation-respiration switch protein FrsA (DUF1100 family)
VITSTASGGRTTRIYLPNDLDESQEHVAIIVGAPYGGVKEQGPGIYAQNKALRGFVALTFDPSFEFGEFYSTPRGYHPNSITQFTTTSSLSFMNFPLLTHIKWISPRPILFVTGEHAHSRYYSEDTFKLAAEPKELYVVPNAGHVDLFDKTDLIPFDKLEEFFTENLAAPSGGAAAELVGSRS